MKDNEFDMESCFTDPFSLEGIYLKIAYTPVSKQLQRDGVKKYVFINANNSSRINIQYLLTCRL